MTYLEQCIKEALRLFPSVPVFARKLGEDVSLGKIWGKFCLNTHVEETILSKQNQKILQTVFFLGKWTLPKGCDVFISPFATHRLPEIYPKPETFNPDRFHPNVHEKRSFYSFLPFSLGPRNCIGNKTKLDSRGCNKITFTGYKFAEMEMKTVLSAVLRRFILSPAVGKELPNLAYRITLRASGGLWINLTHRS